ncbi:MAG: hypothetical protein D6763_02470 [Alphaproteobacteria bacterium]|nr:MAG: hypothetical protein D6763_02470 [Alphaproteobacteria bacterium]
MSDFRLPWTLAAYRTATRACVPLKIWKLRARAREGREDAARLEERLGHPSTPRPDDPLIWLHAAGVSQAEAALPLIDYLSEAHNVLVTTASVPSAEFI